MPVAFLTRHRRLQLGLFGMLAGAAAGIAGGSQASAAAQVAVWIRGELTVIVDDVTTVGCNASGGITFNGAALSPSIACAAILELTLVPAAEFGADMTVDVRAVTSAKFPALRAGLATRLQFGTRKAIVYGSPLVDVISVGTGGKAYGRSGNDVVLAAKRSANTELWGGEGDDFLAVDGPLSSRLEGGPGNDVLENMGGTGSMIGGDGDDILSGASANVSMFGGGGNDVINAQPTDIALARIIDGGPGVDRLSAIANGLRLTATSSSGAQPTIRITSSEFGRLDAVRFEQVSLTGVDSQRIGITMDPLVTYEVTQPGLPGYRLVVTVPAGSWTIAGNTVTAAGFGSVTWANTTTVVVRGAIS